MGWNDQSQPAQASREVAFGSRQDKPQWFRRDIRDELVWHLAIVTRLKRTDKKDRLRGARCMSARVVRALLGGAPHVDQYQASLFIIYGVRKRTTANLRRAMLRVGSSISQSDEDQERWGRWNHMPSK